GTVCVRLLSGLSRILENRSHPLSVAPPLPAVEGDLPPVSSLSTTSVVLQSVLSPSRIAGRRRAYRASGCPTIPRLYRIQARKWAAISCRSSRVRQCSQGRPHPRRGTPSPRQGICLTRGANPPPHRR